MHLWAMRHPTEPEEFGQYGSVLFWALFSLTSADYQDVKILGARIALRFLSCTHNGYSLNNLID